MPIAGVAEREMAIGVSALAYPGLLVEINVRAVTDWPSRRASTGAPEKGVGAEIKKPPARGVLAAGKV